MQEYNTHRGHNCALSDFTLVLKVIQVATYTTVAPPYL